MNFKNHLFTNFQYLLWIAKNWHVAVVAFIHSRHLVYCLNIEVGVPFSLSFLLNFSFFTSHSLPFPFLLPFAQFTQPFCCLSPVFLPSSSFPLFFSSPPPPLLLSFLSPRLFFTFFPVPFLPIPLPFLFCLIYMLSLLSPFSPFTAPIFTKRPLNTGIYSLRSQNNGFAKKWQVRNVWTLQVLKPVLRIRNYLFRIRIQFWNFRVPDPGSDQDPTHIK